MLSVVLVDCTDRLWADLDVSGGEAEQICPFQLCFIYDVNLKLPYNPSNLPLVQILNRFLVKLWVRENQFLSTRVCTV